MRKPNPWIAIPSIAMGALGGILGWVVTDASCIQAGGSSCPGWAALVAGLSFAGVLIGVGLVLVLVYRSLAEWRERGG